jgi:hypothetical protein
MPKFVGLEREGEGGERKCKLANGRTTSPSQVRGGIYRLSSLHISLHKFKIQIQISTLQPPIEWADTLGRCLGGWEVACIDLLASQPPLECLEYVLGRRLGGWEVACNDLLASQSFCANHWPPNHFVLIIGLPIICAGSGFLHLSSHGLNRVFLG